MNTLIVVCEFQIKHTISFKSVYEKKKEKKLLSDRCIVL